MSKNKLKKELSKNLKNLEELVEKVRNTQIEPDDPETWDPDYYSELETNLDDCLALLRNHILEGKKDEYGDPIITQKGILTLIDEWQEENNEDDEEE